MLKTISGEGIEGGEIIILLLQTKNKTGESRRVLSMFVRLYGVRYDNKIMLGIADEREGSSTS